MKTLYSLLSLVATFCLSGCLQVDSLITVKPDGSGTVTQTVMMSKAAVEQIKSMAGGLGGDKDAAAKPFDLMDEAKLKAAAEKMGEGVTFDSAKKVTTDSSEGYTVIYKFADISKLKLNQNPSGAMPDVGGGGKSEEKEEFVTFQFTKGFPSPSKLVINTPVKDVKKGEEKKKPEGGEGMEEMAMQMMQQMFKDMKVSIAVQVEGQIADTDAEYVDGKRVTLLEVDFNKLLADPAKLKEMSKAQPDTLEETKALLKGVPGIKVEGKQSVSIRFQ